MTWQTWLGISMIALGAFVSVAAWRAQRAEHAVLLERLGHRYGIKRWPDESLAEFQARLRNRIIMRGD